MIYTITKDRYLKFNSPLIDYIREKNLYNNENLIYSKKYTNGTFTITNPTLGYINCESINGYPHFNIPFDKCLEEIQFFLNDGVMYNNNFYIRYGDTHPHKSIPKLAQIRNLLIENSLSNMIGEKSKSYYGLGDISLKSLYDFIEKNKLLYTPEELFVKIVNNNLDTDVHRMLLEYDLTATKEIIDLLKKLDLSQNEFLIESSLYENQELYAIIKSNPNFLEELKNNGELKYSLQELMFIKTLLKNQEDVLINIIGSNQMEHVIKVNRLIADSLLNSRFLTYGICRSGDERDIDIWSSDLIVFIEKNNLKISNNFMNFEDLLKILVLINSNDTILDFSKLNKYKNDLVVFVDIINSLENKRNSCNVKYNNDLLSKMSLVCYNLNRSIEMGNQNNFYKYLLSIVNEFESNEEQYSNIEGLYKTFVTKCLDKIGYFQKNKVKELKK